MTVYVDDARIRATLGRWPANWSHMTADTDEELHAFAAALGLKREWFQPNERRPEANHYDVTDTVREQAIEAGAVAETMREGAQRRRSKADERRAASHDDRGSDNPLQRGT